MTMQELLVEKIRTDGGVQSRAAINAEYVTELAALIHGGKKLPPIDVYNDGSDVWAADGFHRLAAHIEAERRSIRCNVHKGTKADAAWASCGANIEHGMRRTNADKRHAVELALKTRPGLSDQAIADHAGVSLNFVTSLRRQVPHDGGGQKCTHVDDKGVRTITGKDGKTYRIPPPPPGNAAKRPIPPPPGSVPRPPPPPPPPPTPPPKSTKRMDGVGKPIPDHLLPLFDRAPEVQALLGQISSVRGTLKRAEESGDALYGDVNFQAAHAALGTAYDAIKATKPHAVCPWCHGTLSDQCRGCGHRGVLGEYRWDTTVPREMKR